MKAKSWKAYNPDAIIKSKLGERLQTSYRKTNTILGYVKEINRDILDDFVNAFQNRIDFVRGTEGTIDLESVSELIQDFDHLKKNEELMILVTQYVFHHLKIPIVLEHLDKEIEITSFNDACENERLMYYLAKAGADVLGDKEGIDFWKKVVALRLRDERIEYDKIIKEREKTGEKGPTMIGNSDGAIKRWISIGLGDFTRAIMDDHKILYRFDKCVTHEVLKDLNDPEFAYISSCYIGDAPEYNFSNKYLRRTQTLHTAPFCDELFWDRRVHEDPEQPSLEFTKNL